MIVHIFVFIGFLSFGLINAADINDVDTLLEKIHHTTIPSEKKELLEKLKQRLAEENKKAQEEADAIIKAKQKVPTKIYDESILKNK